MNKDEQKTFAELQRETRKEYQRFQLLESQVSTCPLTQFRLWFDQAKTVEKQEPNAMALATVGSTYEPSVRMVLLKDITDQGGFTFFTSYLSKKGHDIESNPKAALLFYWPLLERQVRIEGLVAKVSEQESTNYFNRRPRGSRISAVASPQSSVIKDRIELENFRAQFEQSLAGNDPVRPETWGGYEVKAEKFEFWQGREDRLHDRITYEKNGLNWAIKRLAP